MFSYSLSIYKHLERLTTRFCWRTKTSQWKGIIWKSWDRQAIHKNACAMRFCSSRDFNLVMLGKHNFQLMSNPYVLVSKENLQGSLVLNSIFYHLLFVTIIVSYEEVYGRLKICFKLGWNAELEQKIWSLFWMIHGALCQLIPILVRVVKVWEAGWCGIYYGLILRTGIKSWLELFSTNEGA